MSIRYAALLRGVMPTNASNADLKRAFETAGFTDVRTVLTSGNLVFSAPAASLASLERRAEAALSKRLGRSFLTLVRPIDSLRELVASDPYRGFRISPQAKRVVTFLREAPDPLPKLPIEADGMRIVAVRGKEAFSAYLPTPKGPVFMTMIQKAFGKDQTTRTWLTVTRLAGK